MNTKNMKTPAVCLYFSPQALQTMSHLLANEKPELLKNLRSRLALDESISLSRASLFRLISSWVPQRRANRLAGQIAALAVVKYAPPTLRKPAAVAALVRAPDAPAPAGIVDKPYACAPATEIKPVRSARWLGAAQACVGTAHLINEPPTPCQDAACVDTQTLPLLVVCDGAGSSPLSHLGAQAVVVQLRRLVCTLAQDYGNFLQGPAAPQPADLRRLALRLVKHANGVLQDVAAEHPLASVKDVRCTLLLAVGGRGGWLWLRVGDGALVTLNAAGEMAVLGQSGKGEFANYTSFLGDALNPDQVQYGWIADSELDAIAAMTDGAAERLVSMDGQQVALRLKEFFDHAASIENAPVFGRRTLHDFLSDPQAWQGTTGDDRALALLARSKCAEIDQVCIAQPSA